MELHRITLANAPSDRSGEAEYWLTDVRQYEDEWGLEILDQERQPIGQFLYEDNETAEKRRVSMFTVLADTVGFSFGLPAL
jgi:hypothetical protein